MGDSTETTRAAIDKTDETVVQPDPNPHMRQTAYDAENDLREAADRARLRSLQMSDNLHSYVREHPITSLGVAFAAGVVAGAIFKR